MELVLIDAIGPFFKGYDKQVVNWSKLPFDHLETVDPVRRRKQFDGIQEELTSFAEQVSALGYNAATLDDLAHLATSPRYEPATKERVDVLREEYRPLFQILLDHGLQPYLTADILSYTPALMEEIGDDPEAISGFLADLVDRFFEDFPEVAGITFRIGESDGQDIENEDFTSQLVMRKPAEMNRLLRTLLPVFEKHDRRLILRTWTVGAYRIGDLIWHRGTLAKTLAGIDSPNFVLSMKYGESDFFRHLNLNRSFFQGGCRKMIELQGRREYEGCGEFPAFIGNDYERLARELSQADNIIGMSMWCQSGGWVPFRRRAFLEQDGKGVWNEINTAVSVSIFRDGVSVETAVRRYAVANGIEDSVGLLELLRLSEEVIRELFYVRQFAELTLFFRRVRIPPLVAVYWNNLFINHSVRKILRHFVTDGEQAVREGYAALKKIVRMRELAEELGLPADDIEFMHATGEIMALAREFYFLPADESVPKRIEEAKEAYKQKFPDGSRPRYQVCTNFEPFHLKRWHLRWSMAFAMRRKRSYRILDHLFTLHLLGLVYRVVQSRRPSLIPKFARDSAMGIDTIFR